MSQGGHGIPLDNVPLLNKLRADLDDVYSMVPSTDGCMEHVNKSPEKGGCGGYCCQVQNPQVLYSEFLNTWRHINGSWTSEAVLQLIADAIRSYLDDNITKGCIFWDKSTHLCMQHKTRCLACRVYGIMPEDEWKPKYDRLKVLYPQGDFRPQCGLVKTSDGSVVTRKDTDDWWKKLVVVEKSLGVPEHKITDERGGTYRTYHDHIMLGFFGHNKNILIQLSKLRTNGKREEKEKFVNTVLTLLRQRQSSLATQQGGSSESGGSNPAQ